MAAALLRNQQPLADPAAQPPVAQTQAQQQANFLRAVDAVASNAAIRTLAAVEAAKRPPEPNLARQMLSYAKKYPYTSLKIVAGASVATALNQMGLLIPLVSIATYPIGNWTLGFSIPMSPLSAIGVGFLSYAGYESAKGALTRLGKTCSESPKTAALAAYGLYQTGIASYIVSAAAAAATTPLILKIAGIGLGVDCLKSRYYEGTWIPKAVAPIVEAVMNPVGTSLNAVQIADEKIGQVIDAPARALQKVRETGTWIRDKAAALYEHSKTATAVGAAATAVSVALTGASILTGGLFIATAALGGLTLAKRELEELRQPPGQ